MPDGSGQVPQLLARIPLVPAMNTRGLVGSPKPSDAKDQRMVGAVVVPVQNAFTQSASYYAQKRPGFVEHTATAAAAAGNAVWLSPSTQDVISAFGASTSTIFQGGSQRGSISGLCFDISEVELSNTTYWLLPSSDGTLWYLAEDAGQFTSYTADGNNSTTITDIKISGINNTSGLYPGQLLAAGSNIVAGTRVVSVNAGAFTAVLDTATTGGAFNDLAITKTPVAKIIDSDFPSTTLLSGGVAEMDGYIFVVTFDNKLYHSDINSITSWSAASFITANMQSDVSRYVMKHRNHILVFGRESIELFYNAGNAVGSVLSRSEQLFIPIGLHQQSTTVKPITYFAGTIAWCGSIRGHTGGIYMLDGFTPVKISTPTIDNIMADTGGAFFLYGGSLCGQDILYFTDGTVHFIYSASTKHWTEAGFSAPYAFGNIGTPPGSTDQGILAVQRTDTTGKVYTMGAGSDFTDDTVAYTMTIQLSDGGFGSAGRVTVTHVDLIADVQASGTTTLKYSDDDGANFTTHGATFDMTAKRKRIHRLGSYKGHRIWRLEHSANTDWRGQFLDIYGYRAVA